MESFSGGHDPCFQYSSSVKEKATMKSYRDRSYARWRTYGHSCFSGFYRIRLLIVFSFVFAATLLLTRASSLMGWSRDHQTPQVPFRSRYTVVINTWKRNDLLKRSISHYSACQGVDAIRIVWSEPNVPTERLRTSVENLVSVASRKKDEFISVQFDIHVNDDLNNRFKPLDDLRTDAILSIDDDVLVPCSTLETAFSVWTSAPHSMVGFVPRMHWVKAKNPSFGSYEYSYGGWWSVWWMGTYSMVLSKAAFIHKKYLDLYTNELPASIRQYVKDERNCEDIAMSFLVANETGAPPIWIKTRIYEIGSTGISSLQGHSEHRTDCINHFVTLFGSMPLVASNVKVADARHLWFW
ncbi:hypothetical protein KC19_3G239300 [Ceratodon purpureus]|uniref:Glycosyl transferase 64 domain-containing protein n=1 Tax=Ceratodon purpureus TaxID=3225 RepID=A0A8T0IPX2_CERPU|nr:hypothetical protein KC19_3G239300 [Ceratodon purpureus]